MSEYIVSTDELMDFACHFLIEGEKGREYSDEELIEAIKGARFQRLTRCKDCAYSIPDVQGRYKCPLSSKNFRYRADHYCAEGKPREESNERIQG